MYTGSFAGDMAVGTANARADAAERNQALAESRLAKAYRDLQAMMDTNASNLAMRYSLALQLCMLDPDNPLLKDASLKERIFKAAETAFKISGNNFDAAREVGRTFKIPGREKPIVPKEALELERLQVTHASSMALRSALASQLRKFDPDNPVLKDLSVIERVRASGVTAFRAGGTFDASRIAGENFRIPGR